MCLSGVRGPPRKTASGVRWLPPAAMRQAVCDSSASGQQRARACSLATARALDRASTAACWRRQCSIAERRLPRRQAHESCSQQQAATECAALWISSRAAAACACNWHCRCHTARRTARQALDAAAALRCVRSALRDGSRPHTRCRQTGYSTAPEQQCSCAAVLFHTETTHLALDGIATLVRSQ